VIDSLSSQLLRVALATPQSRVLLLTNARKGWVDHSAKEFLPTVDEILREPCDRLSVVSAHREHKQSAELDSAAYAADVAQWKSDAVLPLAQSFQESADELGTDFIQVISLGDNTHDLKAAHTLAGALRPKKGGFVKTVLMRHTHAAAELAGQLRALGGALEPIVKAPRSLHKSMHQSATPPQTSP